MITSDATRRTRRPSLPTFVLLAFGILKVIFGIFSVVFGIWLLEELVDQALQRFDLGKLIVSAYRHCQYFVKFVFASITVSEEI